MPAQPTSHANQTDIIIIGAGPSGAIAGAMLAPKGYRVTIVEKQHFPRFSIGESLLPQCMAFLEEAGVLPTLYGKADALGFQHKNGARFLRRGDTAFYDFTDKFSQGHGTTWQVRRADFDKLLADHAEKSGVEIRYGHSVILADVSGAMPSLQVADEAGSEYTLTGRFLLDASGFGRILPRLLDLEYPSDLPMRGAIFTHITDHIGTHPAFDREKILITVHEQDHRIWFWLIPFADGRASFGVVAEPHILEAYKVDDDPLNTLKNVLAQDHALSDVLKNADFDTPARTLSGYSANVKQLYGNNFALLGNAGEFLDPVFSSGVTIALKSCSMASPLVHRHLQGEKVDWQSEYETPLRQGIDVFRAYVEAWYTGEFQDVVFSKEQNANIRRMVSSLLAGYAWDTTNPMNNNPARHLKALAEYCREQI